MSTNPVPIVAAAAVLSNTCGVMGLLESGGAFVTTVVTDAIALQINVSTAASALLNLPNVVTGIVLSDVQVLAANLTTIAAGAINTLVSHLTAQVTNMVTNLTVAVAQASAQSGLTAAGCGLPSAPPTGVNPCGNMMGLFGAVSGLGSTLIASATAPLGGITSTIAGLTSGALTNTAAALNSITNSVASMSAVALQMTSIVESEVAAQAAAITDLITFTASNQLTNLIGDPCAQTILGSIATEALLSQLHFPGGLPFPPWMDVPPAPPSIVDDFEIAVAQLIAQSDGTLAFPIGDTVTSNSIALGWSQPVNGTPPFAFQPQYRISGSGAAFVNYGPPISQTNVVVSGLSANSAYDFQVVTTNALGSTTSPVRTASTISAVTGAPTAALNVTAGSPDHNSILVSWTVPTGGTTPFNYQVRYRATGALFWNNFGVPQTTTSVTVTGLAAAAQYDFHVYTTNAISHSRSAVVQGATIGFVPVGQSVSLSAIATSSGRSAAIAQSAARGVGTATATGGSTASANGASSAPVAPQLPASQLSVLGSQIVDSAGDKVRITAINWRGAENRNAAPLGLDIISYKTLLSRVQAAGFNCVRVPTCDAAILNDDSVKNINYTANPDLSGLAINQVLTTILDYCGVIGLKVIITSHNNEGGHSSQDNYGLLQPNGLWYDVGGTSDNTDGGGNVGTISAATFQSVWVIRANLFRGKPAIIGYEIRNKPQAAPCTWGDGGVNDLQAMYQTVGNAIHAIDAGPLIICSGPQNVSSNYARTNVAPDGDLTLAQTHPVTLSEPNKVVYSVVEYPDAMTGLTIADSGSTYVSRMQQNWGYLVSNNVAPVWVSECGGAMTQTGEAAWGSTFIAYINGNYLGGPTFTAGQQGIGIGWWDLEPPAGTGSKQYGAIGDWTAMVFDATQRSYWSQALYGLNMVSGQMSGGGSASATAISGIGRWTVAAATGTSTALAVCTPPGLLSAGEMKTSGNQIVDHGGSPQRIAAVVWAGTEYGSGNILWLDTANYKLMLDCIKQLGFNAVRLEMDDAAILNGTAPPHLNTTLNPDLAGLTVLQVITAMVTYGGSIGVRFIIDSHSNAGATGQQSNGLWYGNAGVTQASFITRWQMVATALKGNPGLLGYDLRNEPLAYSGMCTWGDGSINDLRAMYQTVGNAIQAIDQTPLIICEGPQNYTNNFLGGVGAPEGDLSLVATKPVVLNTANKVVYSVHSYPPSVSGTTTTTSEWMTNWGHVYENNIAPIFVGECGSPQQMTASGDTTWAAQFVAFCNGTAGGITVAPGKQGLSTAWFCWSAPNTIGQQFIMATALTLPATLDPASASYIQALDFN